MKLMFRSVSCCDGWLAILKNCRHRHFTWKLHHLIDTVEFTVACLLLSIHDVVIRLAKISITVIYFSPCCSDPKYLGSLGRLEVFYLKEIIRVDIRDGQGCIIFSASPDLVQAESRNCPIQTNI
jgi:hypothetical protein